MEYLKIVGYEHSCKCTHCGRKLRHGIKISTGYIVGATCFSKTLTKPITYRGKSYRLTEEIIIRYAKIAELGTAKRHGMQESDFVFVKAEENAPK
jgi:hypothetical protein